MIKQLFSIGLTENLTSNEVRKVKTLNQICVIGISGSILFIILDLILFPGEWLKAITLLVGILLLGFCIFLQYRCAYFSARLLLLFFTLIIFFFQCNYSFRGFYGEYNYLIVPLIGLFFFEKKWIQYFFLILPIGLFYLPNYFLEIYPDAYFGFANVALLFVAFFFIVRYFKRLNQKNELALAEQKTLAVGLIQQKFLQSQLNPHFIFNSLETIRNDVLKSRPENAANSLSKFAKLMRQTLEQSRVDFISIEDEVELLKNYIKAVRIGRPSSFSFETIIHDGIAPQHIMIPPMMIQPLLENVLAHGLRGEDSDAIRLIFSRQADCISATIIDNGKGLNVADKKGSHTSLSLLIIRERLQLLSKEHKGNFDLKIKNIEPVSGQIDGVEATVWLPYHED
ncbi:MAG: histidine kinase [Cyclobacteriaceae bacterium]